MNTTTIRHQVPAHMWTNFDFANVVQSIAEGYYVSQIMYPNKKWKKEVETTHLEYEIFMSIDAKSVIILIIVTR
jgi:hypothetical protein